MQPMRRALALLTFMVGLLWAGWLYSAADIYFAQTVTGSGNGSSCGNAMAISTINSPGNWSSANTLHICGAITGAANSTAIVAQASGISGFPITIKGESGNMMSAPFWSLTGAINLNGKSFITIDSINIQNTANGTGLANSAGSYGIFSSGGHDITITNTTVSNICLKTTGAAAGCSTSNVQADGIFVNGGGNININHTTVHDAHWLLFLGFPSGTTTTGWDIGFNTLYNGDHMIACGDTNPGGTLSGAKFHDNDMHDMVNWDGSAGFHHDYFHCFLGTNNGASTITALQFYNNYMHGDPGSSLTGFVNLENNTGNFYTNARVFNNILTNSSASHIPGNGYFTYGGSGHAFYNNDILGSSTSQGVSNACFYNGGNASTVTFQNNICSTVGLYFNNIAGGGLPTLSNRNDWFNGGGFFYSGGSHSLTDWQGLGYDANSISVNPGLQPALPFAPGSGSAPVVLKAANLTSVGIAALNLDFRGLQRPPSPTLWDIGATQFSGVVPPAAPTGLTASVAGSTVTLNWTASAGTPTPTGYSLYRGTVHGGPYSLIKTALTSASTTDTPANGTYFYTVTGFVGGLVSTISGNGTTATVTCMTACPSFPTGTTFTIFGDSLAAFNGTFTSTGQPTNSTFTFSSSTNSVGSGGAAWPTSQESAKSNEAQATVPATLTVTLTPASRTFASFTVGTPSPSQTATLTNTSGPGQSVTISSKSFTGADSADYSETDNCPVSLSSGSSCTFNITFTPTAAGTRTASLTVVDNATGSPHTVAVTGTGVAATPGVSLSPTSLNFGDQTLSTTSTVRSIILTNTGTGTLTISSVVASGDFAVTTVPVTNCGTTLASLATCSLNVTFTPTATGGRTGAVTVTDNASGSPHVATLSGNGITTKCQMTGAAVLSGSAGVCQ